MLQSTGQISLGNINVELGRSLNVQISLNGASTGLVSPINQSSPSKPDGSAPHSISEWYGYNHNYNFQVPGTDWIIRNSAGDNEWSSIAYGSGLFVAVSLNATDVNTKVMTSPDGINWTTRNSVFNGAFSCIVYGNGRFVSLSKGSNSGITSTDGINWTSLTLSISRDWQGITYGNGVFVAVSSSGFGSRVLRSSDGINWTSHTASNEFSWQSVTYGNNLFVAVSNNGTTSHVMTSPDGINWTGRTSPSGSWMSITYGNNLFVAVSESGGTGDNVMTSPDGITWTLRSAPLNDNQWSSVTWGNGLFVAVARSGAGTPMTYRVMTSTNGINWTLRTTPNVNNQWSSVTWGNGVFVAVARSGTGNRVMTSGNITIDPNLDVTPPSTVVLSKGNSTGNSLVLNWTSATDNVGVTGYQVIQVLNGATTVTTLGNVNTTTVTRLVNGSNYQFTVKAFDAAGNVSDSSNIINHTPPPTLVAPTGLTQTGSTSSSISMGWNAVAGAELYYVYMDGVFVGGGPDTTFTVSGLNQFTTYGFSVSTVVGSDESMPSLEVSMSTGFGF